MAKTNKGVKKAARKQIEQKLKVTLSTLEPVLGNKKFRKRIKKAGRVFVDGIKNKESRDAVEGLETFKSQKMIPILL